MKQDDKVKTSEGVISWDNGNGTITSSGMTVKGIISTKGGNRGSISGWSFSPAISGGIWSTSGGVGAYRKTSGTFLESPFLGNLHWRYIPNETLKKEQEAFYKGLFYACFPSEYSLHNLPRTLNSQIENTAVITQLEPRRLLHNIGTHLGAPAYNLMKSCKMINLNAPEGSLLDKIRGFRGQLILAIPDARKSDFQKMEKQLRNLGYLFGQSVTTFIGIKEDVFEELYNHKEYPINLIPEQRLEGKVDFKTLPKLSKLTKHEYKRLFFCDTSYLQPIKRRR